ncbi:MAG: ABC transporter permease subunit [Saprospiraceae bacterium]|nr:ABC transporter permease [Bacteroidia bacterium]NNE16275.1 ABC transporter permease subunit [Saprospiraceae bacterium]NNL91577.1 ABC transporter permease subunit [Saprospiraceae bacterium]
MKRLIKIEWAKFKKNNVIILLLTFFCLFLPACLYFGSIIPELPAFLPQKESLFQFPSIWDYLGYAGNWMTFFFLGVLAIYLVTIEINNKTLRQSIINGLSRQEYYFSKVISITIISLLATFYFALISIIVGIFNSDSFSISVIFDNDFAILRFFLMSFAYLSFALFLAFIIRKSGIAVFFYISYVIIIEPLLRYIIINNLSSEGYTNYFPLNAIEDLMPNPIYRYAEAVPNNIDFEFLLTFKTSAILTFIYTALFLGISYWSFIKRDI